MTTKTKHSKQRKIQPRTNLEPMCKDNPNNQSKDSDKESGGTTPRLSTMYFPTLEPHQKVLNTKALIYFHFPSFLECIKLILLLCIY